MYFQLYGKKLQVVLELYMLTQFLKSFLGLAFNFNLVQARLENIYIPDDEITADDVTSDDVTTEEVEAGTESATESVDDDSGSVTVEPAAAPESRDSHSDIISDYKQKVDYFVYV